MWLLHFLPEAIFSFLVYILLLVGITGVIISFFVINKILSKIPGFAKYYRFAQLSSIITLTLGVYLWGGYSMEMAYRVRISELEKEIEIAKEESKKINTVVETKVVTKTKIIKEKGDTIVQRVDNVITVPGECDVLPKDVIDVHNEAAEINKAVDELRKGVQK